MKLVMIGDDGARSAAYPSLGGTIVIGRNQTASDAPLGGDQSTWSDRVSLGFDIAILSDKSFLPWFAGSAGHAAVEVDLADATHPVRYVLSTITSRNFTVTPTQDGSSQVSLVLAAGHGSIGGVTLN